MADSKRARKKEHRDAARAAQAAALRRRTLARLVGVAVVLAVVIFLAFAGDGGDDGAPTGADASPSPTPAEPACGGDSPPRAEPQQYESPPEMTIDESVDYAAVVSTSCGDIEMDLLEQTAPVAVNNFIFLAQEGFYDGLIWHRVEQNSVIQTGDPNGQNGEEPDGPGYTIDEEPPKSKDAYVYGVVGMANAGPGTTGSQWFIVTHEDGSAGFPPDYTIFAEVAKTSYETLTSIETLPTIGGNDPVEAVKPVNPIYIESIEIIER